MCINQLELQESPRHLRAQAKEHPFCPPIAAMMSTGQTAERYASSILATAATMLQYSAVQYSTSTDPWLPRHLVHGTIGITLSLVYSINKHADHLCRQSLRIDASPRSRPEQALSLPSSGSSPSTVSRPPYCRTHPTPLCVRLMVRLLSAPSYLFLPLPK